MTTKEEILRTLAKDKSELQKQFKVRKMALFGSYARGEQRVDSDVDILVNVDLVSSRAVSSKAMKFIESELIYV